jgi:hypothetical protein
MKQTIAYLLLLVLPALATDSASKTFDGEISDSQCGFNVHSLNRSHDEMIKTGTMGKTPEQCTLNCVRGRNGKYVFVSSDKKNAYKLEPQEAVQDFAGRQVRIRGTLVKDTIHVTAINPL